MHLEQAIIVGPEWRKMDEVNTGDIFLIQNINRLYINEEVEFIILDHEPSANASGSLLPAFKQLPFKKIGGDLYMRSVGSTSLKVVIEKVEG